ncbi:MFS transporter [Paenibacillus rhizoplanae]
MTIGIMLVLTTVAFEGLAITTIAATMAQSLQGIHLYGWIFQRIFLLSQLIGTLVIGQMVDKRGVFLPPCSCRLVFFCAGNCGCGCFFWICTCLLQEEPFKVFGSGALITCIYTCVTLHYSDALRTQILAAFSMAFVLPSLIGPYLAGLIASYMSWRFVFWMVVPLIGLALSLTFRSFRELQLRQVLTGPAPKSRLKNSSCDSACHWNRGYYSQDSV